MWQLTEADIRELAGFKGQDAPVTSVYLDVDGARVVRQQDLFHELDVLLRSVRRDHANDHSVCKDLKKVEDLVRGGIDRSHVRGLALFSCSAHGFWKVFELPVAVRSQVVVNHTPSVRQLEDVFDEYERFGVLLADRQLTRMFVYELGELIDSSEQLELLPRSLDDDRSHSKDKARDHVAAHAHDHLKHAAEVAFKMLQDDGFDRLIIGAPDAIANELEGLLHPYLKERLVARCHVRVDASLEEIRQTALEVEADVERQREAATVTRLRDAVGAGRKGVAGLDDTLRALVERRVDVLLVSSTFTAPGWRCGSCSHIARVGRRCPVCAVDMIAVDDVVEEAVEEALAQSCEVEVCVGNADLDVLGQIGALLEVLTTLGVDVGGTKVLGVVADADGTVLAEHRVSTPRGGDAVVDAMLDVITELRRAHEVTAIGAGVPGLVSRDGVLRFAPNLPGVVELPVGERLAAATGLPVSVDNDNTCALWGEHLLGAARDVSNAVLVGLGTGIGGGLLLDGRLVRGAHGFAGEIGHMVLARGGIECVCGRRGCWERYASGSALGRMGREAGIGERGEDVTAAALAGDAAALAVFDEFADWFAVGLVNLVHVLDVERCVIAGGLVEAGEVLIDAVRRAFAARIVAPEHRPVVDIVGAQLGERAGAIGAALLAVS